MIKAFVSGVCCVALLLPGGRVCAQERATRLTLDEAVGLALRENPTLRAKGYELEATRANEITAGLIPNPTAAFTSEKYGGTTFIEQTLTIGQTLETGGKRRRRLDSARAASRVSEYEVADVRRLVVFQVKKSFTDALTALAALQLAAQNLKALADLERLQRLRADQRLARANAWWDVPPQPEYNPTDSNEQTIGFGISLPLRIFDRNQGEIARTRAETSRVDALREAVANQALSEVETAFGALQTEREKVVALRDTYLPKAQKARDTVEFAYRRGGVSLIDFLDAQRTFRETSLEYLKALGNYSTALYQLETAVGGPLEN